MHTPQLNLKFKISGNIFFKTNFNTQKIIEIFKESHIHLRLNV